MDVSDLLPEAKGVDADVLALAEAQEPTPEELAAESEMKRAVWAAIKLLPARMRYLIVMCEMRGAPQKDAAVALGCTQANVSKLIQVAKERMRRHLKWSASGWV